MHYNKTKIHLGCLALLAIIMGISKPGSIVNIINFDEDSFRNFIIIYNAYGKDHREVILFI